LGKNFAPLDDTSVIKNSFSFSLPYSLFFTSRSSFTWIFLRSEIPGISDPLDEGYIPNLVILKKDDSGDKYIDDCILFEEISYFLRR